MHDAAAYLERHLADEDGFDVELDTKVGVLRLLSVGGHGRAALENRNVLLASVRVFIGGEHVEIGEGNGATLF